MASKVFIGLLLFFVTYSEQTFATDVNNKKHLSDLLNALLGHSQWVHMTDVKAKLPRNITKEHDWFSGKELFVNRGLYSFTESIGNSNVNLDNVLVKHCMVTCLLGCVYAYATDTFETLIKDMLSVSIKERSRSKYREYWNKKGKALRDARLENRPGAKNQSKRSKTVKQQKNPFIQTSDDSEEDEPHTMGETNESKLQNLDDIETNVCKKRSLYDEDFIYEISWTIFNKAYRILLKSQKMFEYMHDALSYVFGLLKPEVYTTIYPFKKAVPNLLHSVKWYKKISTNLKKLLPDYIGEDDVDYKSKVGPLTASLARSMHTRSRFFLRPFSDQYCAVPVKEDDQHKEKLLQKYLSLSNQEKSGIIDEVEIQIQELAIKVIDCYYISLGFVYH